MSSHFYITPAFTLRPTSPMLAQLIALAIRENERPVLVAPESDAVAKPQQTPHSSTTLDIRA